MVLAHLDIEYPIPEEAESDIVAFLTCVSSFTDLSDPWTCEYSQKAALKLLESFLSTRDSNAWSNALSMLLRQRIKPSFSKIRSPAITEQARKAIDPLPMDSSASGKLEDTAMPWKYRDPSLVTVLGWIIGSLGLVDVGSRHYKPTCFRSH